jgi:hypothetical protein
MEDGQRLQRGAQEEDLPSPFDESGERRSRAVCVVQAVIAGQEVGVRAEGCD